MGLRNPDDRQFAMDETPLQYISKFAMSYSKTKRDTKRVLVTGANDKLQHIVCPILTHSSKVPLTQVMVREKCKRSMFTPRPIGALDPNIVQMVKKMPKRRHRLVPLELPVCTRLTHS